MIEPLDFVHVLARQIACNNCQTQCHSHRSGQINQADPYQACEIGTWHAIRDATTAVVYPAKQHPLDELNGQGEPTLAAMASNVTAAAARWIAAGFPVVDQATYDSRSRACAACPFWHDSARAGLGKCKAPGCGCTRIKRWLATERCPHPDGPRWDSLNLPQKPPATPLKPV